MHKKLVLFCLSYVCVYTCICQKKCQKKVSISQKKKKKRKKNAKNQACNLLQKFSVKLFVFVQKFSVNFVCKIIMTLP